MKKKSGLLLSLAIVTGIVCAAAGVGLYMYRQRLGIALTDPTPIALVTSTPRASNISLQIQTTPMLTPAPILDATLASPTQQAAPTAQTSVCGETTAWNILILGSDMSESRGPKGSDLIRMVRVDFPNRKVAVFAFSRDLWVDTTGIGLTNPTVNAVPLGRVFYEGRIRSPQFGEHEIFVDGIRASSAALLKNFSISSDHYLALNLSQLSPIVNAIGGVPINIPERTTDPWIGMVIQAGQQTLNGSQAVAYARAIPDSDFGRIKRNQLLMEALRQKLVDSATWSTIPQLYAQFSAVIITDFSPEQINHLACLMKEVSPDSIIQETVRQEWTHAGPQGSLLWDQATVLARLKELGMVP